MPTKNLIKRVTIDGEELVALSPWFYDNTMEVIGALNKRVAELEAILEARGE